ncbi:hypothetical protein DEO72_LG9g1881 [Vigna unguiculata]|uniref:Uncharacterized protein n=1 Tax=Vigna unguiculata TaxID=3917 RepID=A0A4D6N4B5_VIGUN|nr:hypothetical protein DEO72_LG9g1881 [Vigna unguiculata]
MGTCDGLLAWLSLCMCHDNARREYVIMQMLLVWTRLTRGWGELETFISLS